MIDLNELREAIRNMTRHKPIYRLLRDELGLRGYWKQRKRGKPNPMFCKK